MLSTTQATTGQFLLLAHAASTLAMTGVIWFVQVVHYPLFAAVGRKGFAAFEASHRRLTTWVVAPLMLVELVCAAWLALCPAAAAAAPAWVLCGPCRYARSIGGNCGCACQHGDLPGRTNCSHRTGRPGNTSCQGSPPV